MDQVTSLAEFRDARAQKDAAARPAMSPEVGLDGVRLGMSALAVACWALASSVDALRQETLAMAGAAAWASDPRGTGEIGEPSAVAPWQS
jgi:hypothetical protein